MLEFMNEHQRSMMADRRPLKARPVGLPRVSCIPISLLRKFQKEVLSDFRNPTLPPIDTGKLRGGLRDE